MNIFKIKYFIKIKMNQSYKINILSENKQNLQEFLKKFYNKDFELNELKFEKDFESPIDMIELLSTLVDNNEKYPFGIWISIDKDIFINISELNLDKIIRYLLERYPY